MADYIDSVESNVELDSCAELQKPAGNKSQYPSKEELILLYKTYPELYHDVKSKQCSHKKKGQKKSQCKNKAIKGDIHCLLHTHKNLAKYNIPWMCEALTITGKRCQKNKIIGSNYCFVHNKHGAVGHIIAGEAHNIIVKSEVLGKKLLDKDFLDSLKCMWNFTSFKDVLTLMEEIVNRFRSGNLPKEDVPTYLEFITICTNLLQTGKDLKMLDVPLVPSDFIAKSPNNILSLKDKLEGAIMAKSLPKLPSQENSTPSVEPSQVKEGII